MGTGWKDATASVNVEVYVLNTTKLSDRALGATPELV
jgi:hypothetical protein